MFWLSVYLCVMVWMCVIDVFLSLVWVLVWLVWCVLCLECDWLCCWIEMKVFWRWRTVTRCETVGSTGRERATFVLRCLIGGDGRCGMKMKMNDVCMM